MSTNREKAPVATATERIAPIDLDKRGERGWSEDSMTGRCEQATRRIRAHRIHRFRVILLLYLIVNALLIASWVLCAAIGWSAYFSWSIPLFTIVVWGFLVMVVRRRAYQRSAYTEEQIQREMQKLP